MRCSRQPLAAVTLVLLVAASAGAQQAERWLWSTAHALPKETTSEGSGYFSIVEGKNGRLYIGTAKYGHNAFLVEYDPGKQGFEVVVDAQREIGTTATGFAAQAKFHTRNNVGASGRIYVGTKQGYPKEGERREDYLGGYPMVYDPATGKTRVYPIPVPGQGVISVTPDEERGVAYVSTCSDERPIESTHFMRLDLEKGEYRDLGDLQHMYAFIVVDHLGRAYHPVLGGQIARYDPRSDKLERLEQTIDGAAPTEQSLLAAPQSHPINWDVSPDRKTLYSVAMSGNQLYAYDLTGEGPTLAGRSLGKLIATAEKTDCRALCVGPDGTVWAGVAATFPGNKQRLHVVRYEPGSEAPVDHGPIAIRNPDYTDFVGDDGEPLKWHHGVERLEDGTMVPRYVVMGVCAAGDGTVYVTTLYPLTLHEIKIPRIAAVVTEYRHNSHADVLVSRLLQTDTLDDRGPRPALRLMSVFTDQVPDNDYSRPFASRYGFRIADRVVDSLRPGGGPLAVDGVMLVAEHGKYPESETGQIVYPKRRLFAEVLEGLRDAPRPVPVFIDKHLADNWEDGKWIYDQAKAAGIPLMAGSSLPTLWRHPPADVRRDAPLKEIVAVSYHRLDAYGFHALEMVQCLAEQRRGGETGVRAVQTLTGQAVWEALEAGEFDRALLDAALSRLESPRIPEGKTLPDLVREPILCSIEYEDGLQATVLTLNGAVAEWAVAWRYADTGEHESTLFWTQEARPFQHFGHQLAGIERMMHTGQPAWPVERTLLTTGLLDALHVSRHEQGRRVETPQLRFAYQSAWRWTEPPPPPESRPLQGQ